VAAKTADGMVAPRFTRRVEFSQPAAPIGEGEGMIYQKNRAFYGEKQVVIPLAE